MVSQKYVLSVTNRPLLWHFSLFTRRSYSSFSRVSTDTTLNVHKYSYSDALYYPVIISLHSALLVSEYALVYIESDLPAIFLVGGNYRKG